LLEDSRLVRADGLTERVCDSALEASVILDGD
jgi:hypothetical protein